MSVFDEELITPPADGSGFNGAALVAWLNKLAGAMASGHYGIGAPTLAAKGLLRSKQNGEDIQIVLHDGATEIVLLELDVSSGVITSPHNNNPFSVTAAQVGAYSQTEANALLAQKLGLAGGVLSGALSLPAGGLDVGSGELAVSASGYVTRKNSPSFCAHSAPSIGNGALVFPSTDYNNGSHYNPANGRYTAAVAGPHLFSSYVLINTGSGAQAFASTRFRKNGALLPTLFHSARDYSRSYEAIWGVKVIDLNVGDYVDVFCACGSGALSWGGDHSNFLGMFIG